MITYKIKVANLDCIQSENGLADVVKTVHWEISASEPKNWEDLDLGFYKSYRFGSTELDSICPTGQFIPFDQLTDNMIINWIEKKVNISGTDGIYAALAKEIELQKNPLIVKKRIGEI